MITPELSIPIILLLSTIANFSFGSHHNGRRRDSGPITIDVKGFVKRSFSVATAIEKSKGKDMVCSPLSGLIPLAQLALGASKGSSLRELEFGIGMTKNAIEGYFSRLLRDVKNTDGINLDIASRIFVNEDLRINDDYEAALDRAFEAKIRKLDFRQPSHAASTINDWVASETQGNIRSLVSSDMISSSAKLIAVNAIYFKGKWETPFNKAKLEPFFSANGKTNVPMMSRFSTYGYKYSPELFAKVIAIPYQNGNAHMVVVLPDDNGGLKVMLHKLRLAPELLQDVLASLEPTRMNLKLPKFKIETSLNLKNVYEKLGINDIFTKDSHLTEIVKENDPLTVDNIIQKAIIEVTEEGTEAAAASAVILVKMAFIEKKMFIADHPFFFTILAYGEQLFSGVFSGE